MKTFWVNGLNKMGIESGDYVLASEAKAEVDKAKADWLERCRKFRAQDAEEASERIKVLEDTLRPMLEVCKDPKSYDLVRVSEIISKALKVKP